MFRGSKVLCVSGLIAVLAWGGVVFAAEAAPKADNGQTVLARIGTAEIKQQNVDEVINALDPQQKMYYDNEQGKKAVLDELINLEVFARYAEDKRFDEDPVFVERLARVKKELMRQLAVEKLLENVTIDEKETKLYYMDHLKEFEVPAQIRASHILLKEEDEAKKVLQEIKSGTITFEEAAKKYSTCPSKEQNGDLGYFQTNQVVPEFGEVASKLKKGEISSPVQSQFGWHIIRLEDTKPGKIRSFEEVKSQVESNLLRDKRAQVYSEETEKLRKEYGVVLVEKEPASDKKQ